MACEHMTRGLPETTSRFRPELQGLRAVAALLVVIYHIWFNRVSGGVDVFFVLSGFLITGGLVRRIERQGRIEIGAYLVRLVKRLLPAAMLVILAVLVASLVWLPRVRWAETANELLAAIFYFENWQLALRAVDYLAEDAAASPVQHFWALSVQGQFYLLWPLLIGMMAWLIVGTEGRPRRNRMLALMFIVLASSLAYSVYATANNQPAAYFNTFTRLWQFAAGGMIALALPAIRLSANWRAVAGWAGLLAIISCGAVFQVGTVFPGYAALWPTLAAALIIVSGDGNRAWGGGRFLASRPMVALGNISYSLYLWHWPVLVFFLVLTERSEVRAGQGLALILLSLVLAWLTTRLIENPIRFSEIGRIRRRTGYALATACVVPVLLATGLWMAYIERQHRLLEAWWIDNSDYPGAAAIFEKGLNLSMATDKPITPGPLVARQDLPGLRHGDRWCQQTIGEPELVVCEFGDLNSSHTIALVGSSHSDHWLPALKRAAQNMGWRVVTLLKYGCRFGEKPGNNGFDHPSCRRWNRAAMAHLLDLKPDLVFMPATRGSGEEERIPQGYLSHWQVLNAAGIAVLAVRDTPRMNFNVPECVEQRGPYARQCRRHRAELYQTDISLRELGTVPENVTLLDLTDAFCDRQYCYPVIGNVLVYRDSNHITATYARTMGPVIGGEISRIFAHP